MPKYLNMATYTVEGARGLMKEGGTGRLAAVRKVIEAAGGTLEAFYYTYGANDVVLIVDMPSAQAALALSIAVKSSGGVRLTSTPLITPEEVDAACKTSVGYRAPGA